MIEYWKWTLTQAVWLPSLFHYYYIVYFLLKDLNLFLTVIAENPRS